MRQVFRMSLRRAKKDPGKRVKAIEALLKKSHQRFVKPVKKLVTSDRSPQVQSAALKGLGQLNYPESRASLLKMLGRKDFWERRHMLLDALSGLERMGYHHSHFAPMKALFEKGLESKDWFKVQVKILGMLRLARDSQAFSFLLEHLEPPTPKDVNAADNPPASYWEKRWKIWQVWKQEVKKTLFALTLKRFTKAEAYRKWALTKEGRKRLAATDWQRRKKKK